MIFKEIDNMKDVGDICHYFRWFGLVNVILSQHFNLLNLYVRSLWNFNIMIPKAFYSMTCMTVLVCLGFQACMVQWLDQPVTKDATKSATTATSTTPNPDAAKSTTTETSSASGPDTTKSTTTTTSTTHASEPTSTTTATATSTTPGFEAIFAVAGLLAVTFVALRRRC
jgi:PGF-CTERM protein